MATVSFRIPAVALAFALLAAPEAGFAQSRAPAREGNIWGWSDHQPTMAQVRQQEKAVGIAPTPSRRDSIAAAEDQLNRRLLRQAGGDNLPPARTFTHEATSLRSSHENSAAGQRTRRLIGPYTSDD
jgi:hypothetical protein